MPQQNRAVVVLFGPPGAGKSTLARASGLELFDKDVDPWQAMNENAFRAELEGLRGRDVRAVVVRTAPTAAGRLDVMMRVGATHAWMLWVPARECHRRVQARGRNVRAAHSAVAKWWAAFDHHEDLSRWSGQELTDPAGAVHPPAPAPRCPGCGSQHRQDLPCWESSYATGIRRAALAKLGVLCHFCGEPGATSVDHIWPRSLGGGDELANLRPAHVKCNASRGRNVVIHVPRPADSGITAGWRRV